MKNSINYITNNHNYDLQQDFVFILYVALSVCHDGVYTVWFYLSTCRDHLFSYPRHVCLCVLLKFRSLSPTGCLQLPCCGQNRSDDHIVTS